MFILVQVTEERRALVPVERIVSVVDKSAGSLIRLETRDGIHDLHSISLASDVLLEIERKQEQTERRFLSSARARAS